MKSPILRTSLMVTLLWATGAYAAGSNAKDLACVEGALHGDLSSRVEDLSQLWTLGHSDLAGDSLDQIVKKQTLLDQELTGQQAVSEDSTSPPPPWNRLKMGWAAYIEGMPTADKQTFVTHLLEKHAGSSEDVAKIIRGLEPEEGVRDAVTKFLAKSGLLANAEKDPTSGAPTLPTFSEAQIRDMFTGHRFENFFPWAGEHTNLVVHPREKLVVAVETSPIIPAEDGLDPAYLGTGAVDRKHYEPSVSRLAVRQVLGFDPIVLPRVLKNQLDAGLHVDGLTPDQQLAGLLVQGHYEHDGNSLYVDFSAKRGVADVETDIPKINAALKKNLETGLLSKEPELTQRLFSYNWGSNSNHNLIMSLRQTALRVAEQDKGFTPLRIEIHAFPTVELYGRVSDYVAQYKKRRDAKPAALREMNQCLTEMEGVLGIGKGARGIDDVIGDLKGTAQEIARLQEIAGTKFDKLKDPFEKLDKIEALRTSWGSDHGYSSRLDYYLGDREFAGLAMRTEKEAISNLPKDPLEQLAHVVTLGNKILTQVQQDNFLNADQIGVVRAQMQSIAEDKAIQAPRKLELISDLLNNAVDQVYYGLKRPYGLIDERVFRMASHGKQTPPVKFLDGTLRSNNAFMLSQLVDAIEESSLDRKNISHTIGDQTTRIPARVFNPGEAVGILRLNKNPMELTSDEIGVFSEMPTESGTVGGIVTLGVGARLSHLQLLAKSLKIPNVKFSPDAVDLLKTYDGQLVQFVASASGKVEIVPIAVAGGEDSGSKTSRSGKLKIKVPVPDHSVTKPVTFAQAAKIDKIIAGPKGMVLSKLRSSPVMKDSVPDGFILPFGFFRRYLEQTGIEPLVDMLGKIDQKNTHVIAEISRQIRDAIAKNPVPEEMMTEVMAQLDSLQKRTGHEAGYFFRSDTNIEDLPGFNGAGLNESVPNVKLDQTAAQKAIKTVWESAFKEKSIFWRGRALGTPTVPIAEPSIVVMPTVFAESSGVIISRGGKRWQSGKGYISANHGIGSVVEAGAPTEEITLEGSLPHRFSFTSSNVKPSAKSSGGLENVPVMPGMPVLSPEQIEDLKNKANDVENILGDEDFGWDIEWTRDINGKIGIVQARPNTG